MRVPPQNRDFAIIGEQFPDLGYGDIAEIVVHAPVLGRVPTPFPGSAPRMDPVLGLGVVKPKLDAVFPGGFGQGFEYIFAVRRRRHDIPVTGRGIEQGETIMVLGRDDDVLHAASLAMRTQASGS
jgi:hypothetical protein